MTFEQLLFRLQQKSLLQSLSQIAPNTKKRLLDQLSHFDLQTLETQISLIKKPAPPSRVYSPCKKYILKEAAGSQDLGESLLASGKVATIVLAGGQGTRLNYNLPKGLFPLSVIKQKSAFQLLSEKALAVRLAYGKQPRMAIMTSDSTHQETVEHFQKNHFFGLAPDRVHFFSQGSLPLLQDTGELSIDDAEIIRSGPDGNGKLFFHFAKSGLINEWKREGIEYISVVQIDNPLADPFPLPMLAAHLKTNTECTACAIMRQDPDEKVGVFVEAGDHLAVIEYSEMAQSDFYAVDLKGNLQYPLANISYFLFSLSFIEKIATLPLPLHHAKKQVPGTNLMLWKFEYFIFDLLDETTKAQIFLADRSECFSPLKNAQGESSVSTVQKALLERDRQQYFAVSGVEVPKGRLFELAMPFYYPTDDLKNKWRGKPLPQAAYIEP